MARSCFSLPALHGTVSGVVRLLLLLAASALVAVHAAPQGYQSMSSSPLEPHSDSWATALEPAVVEVEFTPDVSSDATKNAQPSPPSFNDLPLSANGQHESIGAPGGSPGSHADAVKEAPEEAATLDQMQRDRQPEKLERHISEDSEEEEAMLPDVESESLMREAAPAIEDAEPQQPSHTVPLQDMPERPRTMRRRALDPAAQASRQRRSSADEGVSGYKPPVPVAPREHRTRYHLTLPDIWAGSNNHRESFFAALLACYAINCSAFVMPSLSLKYFGSLDLSELSQYVDFIWDYEVRERAGITLNAIVPEAATKTPSSSSPYYSSSPSSGDSQQFDAEFYKRVNTDLDEKASPNCFISLPCLRKDFADIRDSILKNPKVSACHGLKFMDTWVFGPHCLRTFSAANVQVAESLWAAIKIKPQIVHLAAFLYQFLPIEANRDLLKWDNDDEVNEWVRKNHKHGIEARAKEAEEASSSSSSDASTAVVPSVNYWFSPIRKHPTRAQIIADAPPASAPASPGTKTTEPMPDIFPKRFVVGAHYRGGDRVSLPLLDCARYNFTLADLDFVACTHKWDPVNAFVTFEEALISVHRVNFTRRAIYVAAHPRSRGSDIRFQLFEEALVKRGARVFMLADLEARAQKADPDTLDALKRAVSVLCRQRALVDRKKNDITMADDVCAGPSTGLRVESWIDEIISSEVEHFLGHGFSSWTEYIIYMRKFMRKPGHMRDFNDFAQNVMNYPRWGYPTLYYDGNCPECLVLPNLVTRCPKGSTVSGRHCCCDAPHSRCLSRDPALCTMHRSPLNHKSLVPAFPASCLDCACSIANMEP